MPVPKNSTVQSGRIRGKIENGASRAVTPPAFHVRGGDAYGDSLHNSYGSDCRCCYTGKSKYEKITPPAK